MQLAKCVLVKIEGVEKAVFDVRTVSWQGLLHSLGGGAPGLHIAALALRSLPQIRLGRFEALLQRTRPPQHFVPGRHRQLSAKLNERWIFVAGHVQASLIFLYRIHNPAAAREIVPLLQSLGLSSTL